MKPSTVYIETIACEHRYSARLNKTEKHLYRTLRPAQLIRLHEEA